MSGGFRKIQRKLCVLASFSTGLPGSVIAAKWRPGFRFTACSTCGQKYAKCESVSIVPPDLLETMNSDSFRLIRDSTRWMVAGSVVSRTCSRGWPLRAGNVCRSTSGQRLEPPMPSSTTSE